MLLDDDFDWFFDDLFDNDFHSLFDDDLLGLFGPFGEDLLGLSHLHLNFGLDLLEGLLGLLELVELEDEQLLLLSLLPQHFLLLQR